ncbi:ATP-binding protein [Streptomyces sp. NBC_01166]|uniref:ATP-binding protein n=1 Tax=Streptomyces sp. NBC_01166 TaxID=2903755 RepID=UPI00386E0F4A|nr:ATP-binding protein [Streptomyces sp. NBC_01166]
MHPYAPPPQRAALCPARAPRPAPGLVLSLTLPGDPRSAAVGRHAVAASLPRYGLHSYAWPVTLAVTELIAVNAALTPGRELYLSLRHRDDVLRLVLWDQHPRHTDPDTLTLCEARRRRALWLLAAVVDDWGGEWGVTEGPPPHRGTKSWALLPR